ncbi:MAG: MBL fold metallo-hydrolase [Bacteroidales bacterium]|nr:MBL fold metallo-hydrolase [Bacteroidales bacterium]
MILNILAIIIASFIVITFFTILIISNLKVTGSKIAIKNNNLKSIYKNNCFENYKNIKLNFSSKDAFKMTSFIFNKPKDIKPKKKYNITIEKEKFTPNIDEKLKLIWFGHSCVLIFIDGKKIIFDPSLSENASPIPFGVKRFTNISEQSIKNINPDIVIYSHDHYDHLDYKTFNKLKRTTKHFISPLGVAQHIKYWDAENAKNHELDWWQELEIEGLKIICTPAQHFSGRKPVKRNNTLWASFVIIGKSEKIFFSGDGGYGEHLKEIGDKYGPFDLTMLECGQYNELWQQIHMLPEQTILAHSNLKGRYLLPIHWGAFALSVHSWTEPIERVLKAAEETKNKILTPEIGELTQDFDNFKQKMWWKNSE